MKNQKGITMASLGVYIVVSIIVVATLATIMANYKNSIKTMDDDAEYSSEYSKFNLYFLEEAKKQENQTAPKITTVDNDYNSIEFKTENEFKYDIQKEILFLNKSTGEKIKLIKNVKKCTFKLSTSNGKNIVTVEIQIGDTSQKELKYVLGTDTNSNLYATSNEYTEGIITIPTGWDSSKLNSKDPFRTEKINAAYSIAPIPKEYEVSSTEGEDKISNGLIITDADGTNRFKWYPKESEELSKYLQDNLGKEWNPADSTGLTTDAEIYSSFQKSSDLYGGVYIKEDSETIKTILWIK